MILGEIPKVSGSVKVGGRVAYVPQQVLPPFLLLSFFPPLFLYLNLFNYIPFLKEIDLRSISFSFISRFSSSQPPWSLEVVIDSFSFRHGSLMRPFVKISFSERPMRKKNTIRSSSPPPSWPTSPLCPAATSPRSASAAPTSLVDRSRSQIIIIT